MSTASNATTAVVRYQLAFIRVIRGLIGATEKWDGHADSRLGMKDSRCFHLLTDHLLTFLCVSATMRVWAKAVTAIALRVCCDRGVDIPRTPNQRLWSPSLLPRQVCIVQSR
ncbi:hypothetical protein [Novipirellula caenicola]|uniref:hypothetical protein n=1 Tax=Novipirellula caenicola TaxID=1536901 RepID=UPI0031F09335